MVNHFFRAVAACGLLLFGAFQLSAQPEIAEKAPILDDFVVRKDLAEHRVLPYQPVREADIFWEKRLWRVIDVREKQNQTFADAKNPFFDILQKGIETGEIAAYSTEDDHFTKKLTPDEVLAKLSTTDSIPIMDIETGFETVQVVKNILNSEDVKRFRIKETWFFDKNIGQLKCRILGIAPLISVIDENTGDFRYETPLFWVHYPSAREPLARHQVFNAANDAAPMSWEDVFEMRHFSSTIYKESNIADQKIEAYATGRDALLEAEKINSKIFNFESDLWSW
jgi:gliding motility associated protien GldN